MITEAIFLQYAPKTRRLVYLASATEIISADGPSETEFCFFFLSLTFWNLFSFAMRRWSLAKRKSSRYASVKGEGNGSQCFTFARCRLSHSRVKLNAEDDIDFYFILFCSKVVDSDLYYCRLCPCILLCLFINLKYFFCFLNELGSKIH